MSPPAALLVGYNGANNTGAEALLQPDTRTRFLTDPLSLRLPAGIPGRAWRRRPVRHG